MRGKLRKKELKNGQMSIYIDYYPPVWNPISKKYSRREFLKLYWHPNPKNSLERKENELSNEIAEKIYLKRMKSLMLDANSLYNKDVLEGDFYNFYSDFIKHKQLDDIETALYRSALSHLKKWRPEQLKFKHIDELFLQGFKNYLKAATFLRSKTRKLSANSKASYYDKLAYVVHEAYIGRYLPEDYTVRVKRLPNVDSYQERLEQSDVRLLIQNPCADEMAFKSSVFALLSGFRFSAVEILKWEDFHYSMDVDCWYIMLVDPKPRRPFKHFISEEAMAILGEKQEGSKHVFEGINYHKVRNELLKWFDSVGLKNKARFHNWRRRYSSDLKESDVDIYVIKDMLNHKFVQTTEIYTDNSDQMKANAAKIVSYK